jgi:(p)ppGpp synthase/HD superfamily hydrolase
MTTLRSISRPDPDKQLIAARYWLLGLAENEPVYFDVIRALELCITHHDGVRNGGEPEWSHQIGIFHQVRTQHKHIAHPALVYILIFLHDAVEDPNQKTNVYITLEELQRDFSPVVADKVRKMSKKIMGQDNPDYSLETIFADEDCSIAKAGDRVNNVSTMVGVFKPARLDRYRLETADHFLPNIKKARRKFPHQESVYEAMRLQLVNQLVLIEHIIGTEPIVE